MMQGIRIGKKKIEKKSEQNSTLLHCTLLRFDYKAYFAPARFTLGLEPLSLLHSNF